VIVVVVVVVVVAVVPRGDAEEVIPQKSKRPRLV
jgi:hypothetical protein